MRERERERLRETMATPLELKLSSFQLDSNKQAHRTSEFLSPMLIVRRGDPFTITLSSNRAVQPGDQITFIVETGPAPSELTKTKATFPLTASKGNNIWSAVQKSSTPSSLDVSISSPADAVIGDYKLSVQTSSRTSSNLGVFRLLFNAWCKDDAVYMDNENFRKEYILNHFGIYFKGSEKYTYGSGWDYGQFEEDILDICLTLLDQSPEYSKDKVKDYSNRYDPNYVSKIICSMISINDGSRTTMDTRIMVGKWERDYGDGKAPGSWNSSSRILKMWKSGGYRPVKYGQCWVFAGVLCTALRGLGIPTRLITNYNSGVDTALDLVVDDYVIDYSGSPPKPPPKDDCDEVWDFHVWNEGWFRRTDLDTGKKYDGWQALDPTRQKRQGVSRTQPCGPASVKAVKEGDVDKNYDTAFVYAEIGSDYVAHVYTSPTTVITKERVSGHIGKNISTKVVGKDDPSDKSSREDVTDSYKYPDGSPDNRRVYKKACDILHIPTTEAFVQAAVQAPNPEISGRFIVPETIEIGQDVSLSFILKNLTSGTKTVKVDLSAFSTLYTGKQIQEILKESKSVSLAASKEQQIPFKIPYQKYESALTEDNMIRAIASCEDTKTKADLILEQDVVLKNPTINITVVERAVMKKPLNVEIAFQNNLPSAVKNCSLVAVGSGLIKDPIEKTVSPVKPKERIKISLQITPYRAGAQKLLLNFNCDKLKNVKGFKTINVQAA